MEGRTAPLNCQLPVFPRSIPHPNPYSAEAAYVPCWTTVCACFMRRGMWRLSDGPTNLKLRIYCMNDSDQPNFLCSPKVLAQQRFHRGARIRSRSLTICYEPLRSIVRRFVAIVAGGRLAVFPMPSQALLLRLCRAFMFSTPMVGKPTLVANLTFVWYSICYHQITSD